MRNFIVGLLALPNVSPAMLRVGLVVLELTGAQRKLSDGTVRAQVARYARVSERTVSRCLGRMADEGLIEWRPARAKGQLGHLRLIEPESFNCLALDGITRDEWLSRVQLNARQEDNEPETTARSTRDTQESHYPLSTSFSPQERDDAWQKEQARLIREALNEQIALERLDNLAIGVVGVA
jgi:hypothetical protein